MSGVDSFLINGTAHFISGEDELAVFDFRGDVILTTRNIKI